MARIEFLSAPDGKPLETFREECRAMAEALNARRQSAPAVALKQVAGDLRPLTTVTVGDVHKDPVRKIDAIFYAFFSDHDKEAHKMFKRAARTKEEKEQHALKRIAKQRARHRRRAKPAELHEGYHSNLCW